MSVNVTGNEGALEWDASINTDQFEEGINVIVGGMQKAVDKAVEVAKETNDSLSNIGDPLKVALKGVDDSLADLIKNIREFGNDPALEALFTKYADLQKQELILKDSLGRATDPEQIRAYNEQLDDTHAKMKAVTTDVANLPGVGSDLNDANKTIAAYTRLRQIKNELAQIRIDGGEGSANFQNLTAEATGLEKAIKNTNSELKLAGSNTAGLDAIGQGVRGLVGGFQALAGAITIFGGDSKEAEEATKDVIGAMGILNGIQEVGALLSKESALNVYLLAAARKVGASAAAEQAVATEGIALAEGEVAVTTAAATAEQIGLNAAMLANPVGIILASLVALYGAYEVYARTLGKATDAERARKDAAEAYATVMDKSVDDIAKEESALASSLSIAKSDVSTRKDKEDAINRLSAKYPEYLGQLTLENINTAKGNDLIAQQIELIKKKSFAAAAEGSYADSLKEQIKLQNELTEVQKNGTTLLQRLSTIGEQVEHSGVLITEADRTNLYIKNLQKEIDRAKEKSNAFFDTLVDGNNKLNESYQAPSDKIRGLIGQLDLFITKNKNFAGSVASLFRDVLPKNIEPAFNKEQYDEQYNLAKASIQREVDATDQGNIVKISTLKKGLAELEYQYVLHDKSIQTETGKSNSIIEDATAKHLGTVIGLNNEANQRILKSNTDAANAIVTSLEAQGKGQTDAYYDARSKAIKASAAEEIFQERYNAEAIKSIRSKLALDLQNLSVQQNATQISASKSALQAQLNQAKEGSAEEFKLRLALLNKNQEEEENVLGITAQKKLEIETSTAKQISDITKKYIFDSVNDGLTAEQSTLNARLAVAEKGSKAELDIQKKLIENKQASDILSAKNQVENEAKKVAKIQDINAKALKDTKNLQNSFDDQQLQYQFSFIDKLTSRKNQGLNSIIDSSGTSDLQKFKAQKEIIDNEIAAIDKKESIITANLITQKGDADNLGKQLDVLNEKRSQLEIDKTTTKNSIDLATIKQFADYAGLATDAFQQLAQTFAPINQGLSEAFKTMGDITKALGDAGNLAEGIFTLNPGEIIKSTVALIGDIVKAFSGGKASEAAAAKEIQRYQDDLLKTGIEYNLMLRDRVRTQQDTNNLTVQELITRQQLLDTQKQQAQQDYNTLLAQIQFSGNQVTGEHTEKYGGILGINRKTRVVQDLAGLSDTDYDQLDKLFTEGKLDTATAAWFQELQKVHDELDAIGVSAQDAIDAENQASTGTTASSITDNIIQGFADGKRASADFADDFESLMKTAVLNSLKYQALEKPLNAFYQQFAADAESDGILTSAEIEQLRASYNATIQAAGEQFDQLKKITDLSFNSTDDSNSLQGAIKGITQQQADLLAGQFGGLRMTAFDQLAAAKSCLNALNEIVNNTSLIAETNLLLRKFDLHGIKVI